MASHQVSLNHDVYNKLKMEKREGESFSDVILRLLQKVSNVDKVIESYGDACSNDNEDESLILETYKKSSDELRKNFSSRME